MKTFHDFTAYLHSAFRKQLFQCKIGKRDLDILKAIIAIHMDKMLTERLKYNS